MANAAEFRKARELWVTLRTLTAQKDAFADHLTLEQHQPYAGLDHVLATYINQGVLTRAQVKTAYGVTDPDALDDDARLLPRTVEDC
jgi:hypothetical protein